MSAAAVRILVVGTSTAVTQSTLKGLARAGWDSHAVATLREAQTVLRTIRFPITLATEKLSDGTGYELAPLIAEQCGSLFISVLLSETCLWLPAVENGVKSLGERALNPLLLANEAEILLRACEKAMRAAEGERGRRGTSSGSVGRMEALPADAAEQLSVAARFVRQPSERFERGEDVASRKVNGTRSPVIAVTDKVAKHAAALVPEGVVRDLAGLGKRWRGL